MTLQELLAQVLGGGSSEPVRLADGPASYRTRGNLPQPQAPDWVQGMPRRIVPRYRQETIPQDELAPFPYAPTTRPVAADRFAPRGHPAAYQDFAGYAQDAPRARLGTLAAPPVEPPQAPPQGVGGYSVNPATGGALRGPADGYGLAPQGEQVQPMMDQHTFALLQAVERARAARQAENEALWATLPRPGRPATSQLALFGRRRDR